ncbi:probable LRR receptor-like serine/threonine-protein kinase At1g67720 isoform X2 [Malus sylvestris]|uniref:probable LRR receptor-like serine/threonine-protein kinase At1g67720 isoform X2 n=1 Tax=Malus sylvestris TaxID=3752 RepID=UPI0021AD0B48|nr:probable LRR receptor-like serine/threonine-protein kinase At1g67720 isoform X2 [Malus sylvestris]
MGFSFFLFIIYLCFISSVISQVQDFVSIDCGGTSNYTDTSTGLAWISDVGLMSQGKSVQVENPNGNLSQFQRRRDFPIDSKKYCYTLNTVERRRYLVRATFQYGSLKSEDTYPKFELYLDATQWATVTIFDVSRTYVNEMIIRASSDSVDVCICCATTGFPFISTLELRPLNLSMYATDYEDEFFLKVAARVNFGAPSKDAIRYPDDPYDRIWDSDLVKRQNYLVGVAPGTERISTSRDVDTRSREYPPVKVIQTAVVGTKGVLSYRLNLDGFPGMGRAYAYFAEIEDLGANENRKFKLEQPFSADYNSAVVNIAENANGDYRLYEPSYMNVSLEFVLSFAFVRTPDSTRGPLLNAMEISKYVQIAAKTDRRDLAVLNVLHFMAAESLSVDEGDPCAPTPWEWVNCSSTAPPRITKMWLGGNYLTGQFPDISNLINLKILHLENNKLSGSLPSYLASLPSLQELYIQNNSFSGEIPAGLLRGKITFKYEYNIGLRKRERKQKHFKLIIGISVGVVATVSLLLLGTLLILRNLQRKSSFQRSNGKGDSLRASTKPSTGYSISRMDEGIACYITLPDLEEATSSFSKRIGKGSFGSVYYGKMKDGKEIAVKMMAESSTHMNKQFVTEVALLSRIHHRNLVPLTGYCEEEHQCILVYEYMHNGTLRDHIHGSTTQKHLDWQTRLRIAEDAAKGLEYLHTGCNPSIIHRDVKTSNILLDINMRAKVSDFGLSRQAEEDVTHLSSVARGTVGYLDPEYYASQQLTEKSDVYSFGVVLLELISGKKPVSTEDFGSELNIVHWARSLILKGDVESIIDPILAGSVKVESMWRIAEVAIQCVEQHGVSRPRMQEIIVAVQDAMKIEKGSESNQKISPSSSSSKAQPSRKTLLTSFLEIEGPDLSKDCLVPSAR